MGKRGRHPTGDGIGSTYHLHILVDVFIGNSMFRMSLQ